MSIAYLVKTRQKKCTQYSLCSDIVIVDWQGRYIVPDLCDYQSSQVQLPQNSTHRPHSQWCLKIFWALQPVKSDIWALIIDFGP